MFCSKTINGIFMFKKGDYIMNNSVYVAEVHGKVVKVADSFKEAFEALPMENTGQCFGVTCKRMGIVYHIERDHIKGLFNGEEDGKSQEIRESVNLIKTFEDRFYEASLYLSSLTDNEYQQMILQVLQTKNDENEIDLLKIKEKTNIASLANDMIELLKKSILSLYFGQTLNEQENLRIEHYIMQMRPKLTHKIKANFSQLCNVAYLRRLKNERTQNINIKG